MSQPGPRGSGVEEAVGVGQALPMLVHLAARKDGAVGVADGHRGAGGAGGEDDVGLAPWVALVEGGGREVGPGGEVGGEDRGRVVGEGDARFGGDEFRGNEGGEFGDKGKVREWLARAVNAPRDPAWTADGVLADRWAPISPVTGALDAFQWRVPVEGAEMGDGAAITQKLDKKETEQLIKDGRKGDHPWIWNHANTAEQGHEYEYTE